MAVVWNYSDRRHMIWHTNLGLRRTYTVIDKCANLERIVQKAICLTNMRNSSRKRSKYTNQSSNIRAAWISAQAETGRTERLCRLDILHHP